MLYKENIERNGWFGFLKKVTDEFSSWRNINIKIAVTGESGAGKSTFINSIRGLKSDDEGAAPIGLVETTMKATKYEFPNNKNIELWDLPGFGTTTFKDKGTYLQHVNWKGYEAILLLSAKRFTENDAWLAGEIMKKNPEQQLFFVRTHVKQDMENIMRDRRRKLTQEDVECQLKAVRDDSAKQLRKIGIMDHMVFLIDSHQCNAFDYKKLVKKMVLKASALKKEALILSLAGITDDVINMKLCELGKRINGIAKVAGAAGANTDRKGRSYPAEVEVMFNEASVYREQLDLNLRELKNVAKQLNENIDALLRRIDLQSYEYGDSAAKFAWFYRQYDNFEPGFKHWIPIVGKRWKAAEYQKQCEITLKNFLDICAKDVRKVQGDIKRSFKGQ